MPAHAGLSAVLKRHADREAFRYAELFDDWPSFTTVESERWGPPFKSRLMGDAPLRREGVSYFKNTLKKQNLQSQTQIPEFLIFLSKFEVLLRRLKAAQNDLMPVITAQST